MNLPTLQVQKSDIQGFHQAKGIPFGVILSLHDNPNLKTGMKLIIGKSQFTVTSINGLNPNKNTYILSLSGGEILDLILQHS